MAEPFIGEIRMFGFNFTPRGWALCGGALLPISTNSTLFSLLGTIYGGDGRTSFALPDFRGRVPMAKGRHPGSLYDWRMGQKGGAETHILTLPEMPTHNHTASFTQTSATLVSGDVTINCNNGNADKLSPDGNYPANIVKDTSARPDSIPGYSASSNATMAGGMATFSGTISGGGGEVVVNPNGGSKEFSIIQPSLVVNFCIAMIGVYPPRS